MEDNDHAEGFDDFFDTPGRPAEDSPGKSEKIKDVKAKKTSPSRSAKKQQRGGGSRSDRSSMSERDASSYYSSDSVTESDSDSKSPKRRRQKSRSRSASSRSAGSYSSSGESYSSRDSRSQRSSKKKGGKRSPSSSSSRSRSRTATPDSTARERNRGKGKSKRRDSYSSVSSSDTYSESKESGRRSPSPRAKEEPRQAWNNESKSRNTRQERPKTAKHRSSEGRRSDVAARRERKGKYSPADSESDMTDVSPIMSPRNGSVNGHDKVSKGSKPPIFQAMPLDGTPSAMGLHDGGDNNALDLSILMKAVSELEKQKRVKSNTRRVMFEPLRARAMDKSNYTFSNDDTQRIELENQRLLQQIVRQMHQPEERRPRPTDLRVQQASLTASAVNRRRDQKRIENDNLSFLRRLQKIKPSRGISRNEQLTAYNTTVLHGIPIATLHPSKPSSRSSGRTSSASSVAGSLGLGRTRSMTSVHSAATMSSFGTASRQSSRAGSRPSSAKKSARVDRPAWNERW